VHQVVLLKNCPSAADGLNIGIARPENVGRLASIIIPCWNQLEFTRQCITALRMCTRPPWELIVVDNGSTDGTAAYLNGVQNAAAVPVTVISSRDNRGFPAAINQGLKQARGEFLVLLNNDVVVTAGWLDQLTGLAQMRIDLGRAGGSRWLELIFESLK
jgi:O-antigen biosynthesis protein